MNQKLNCKALMKSLHANKIILVKLTITQFTNLSVEEKCVYKII